MDINSLKIEMSNDQLHLQWLKRCYEFARNSQHPSTHNAALLVKDNQIVLEGVNNLPPNVEAKPERFLGENKHVYLNHAERDVLYKAARKGIATEGLIMVMPWLPCIPCSNAIITSGIKQLIVHRQMIERTRESWKTELMDALQIMREADVKVLMFEGAVGTKAFMHGQEWEA